MKKTTAAATKTRATKTPTTAATTADATTTATTPRKATKGAAKGKAPKPAKKKATTKRVSNGATPITSKKAIVIALISRKGGATLTAIMAATAWQAHSIRGLISTLNKGGAKIASSKSEAGARTYQAA